MSIDAKAKKALEEPFPPEKIQKKGGGSGPRGRPPLPYISHGLVTERLCDVDPDWSSQHLETHTYTDREGNLHCAGVTIALTVKGVTRVESGGPERSERFALEIKNAMSDALKRAAMRFGVALSMWEDLVDAEGDEDYANRPANAQNGPSEPRNAPQAQRRPNAPPRPAQAAPANAQVSPSERQRREQLWNLSMAAKEAGINGPDLDRLSMEQFQVMAVSLEMQEAIDLIGMIESGVRPSGWYESNDTPEPQPITDKTSRRMWIAIREKNLPEQGIRDYWRENFGVESSKQLTEAQALQTIEMVAREKPRPKPEKAA